MAVDHTCTTRPTPSLTPLRFSARRAIRIACFQHVILSAATPLEKPVNQPANSESLLSTAFTRSAARENSHTASQGSVAHHCRAATLERRIMLAKSLFRRSSPGAAHSDTISIKRSRQQRWPSASGMAAPSSPARFGSCKFPLTPPKSDVELLRERLSWLATKSAGLSC